MCVVLNEIIQNEWVSDCNRLCKSLAPLWLFFHEAKKEFFLSRIIGFNTVIWAACLTRRLIVTDY